VVAVTWTRLSDDYSDDCWQLSDKAFRLHTEALVWSNRKLLDCRIPLDDVRRFARHPEAVPELLAAGWWTEKPDHYVLRHHAGYQWKKERVLRQQAANRANALKGGRPPKPPREDWPETHSVSEPQSERRTGRDGMGREGIALMGEELEPCFSCDNQGCPDCLGEPA
jgi:hypothetical protein